MVRMLLTKWAGFVTNLRLLEVGYSSESMVRVKTESLHYFSLGRPLYGFEYLKPPFGKMGFEQRFDLRIPGSFCTSLLVKLRGAFKSIFAFLILLEQEVATQSPSGVWW